MSRSCHRPDEHSRIQRHILHADTITQQRSAGERRGWIDRNHSHGQASITKALHHECRDRALAGAWRTSQSYASCSPRSRMQAGHHRLESIAVVFDDAHYSRQGSGLPRVEIIQQSIRGHGPGSFPVCATFWTLLALRLQGVHIRGCAECRAPRAGAAPPAKTRPAASRLRARSPGRCRCPQRQDPDDHVAPGQTRLRQLVRGVPGIGD